MRFSAVCIIDSNKGSAVINIEIFPASSIFEAKAFSPASLQESQENCVIKQMPSDFRSIIIYSGDIFVFDIIIFNLEIMDEISDKIHIDIITEEITPIIKEYSGFFFFNISDNDVARSAMPLTEIMFIFLKTFLLI